MSVVDEFRRDEERVLDRLVDGELSQEDRRELLAALDDEPGAWRRCGLAFIESQTWRWQLSRVAAEPLVAQLAAPRRDPNRYGSSLTGWGSWLAIAASVLVAFGLGTRFQQIGQTKSSAQLVEPSVSPSMASGSAESMASGAAALADEVEDQLPETITLTMAEDDEPIELPIIAATEDDPQWEFEQETGLAAELLRQLQDAGLEVNRQRRLWPVKLSDGRQLIVPVEQVEIRYPEFVQNQ